jgi:hypothetical protein
MSNLLDDLYQKDTQTRIATGGARGIDPTIVEKVRGAELADMGQKAAVQAGMAENMRQNRVEEGLQKDYMKQEKLAQGLEAASFLGTTVLGSREGAKPAVPEQGQWLQDKPLNIKPVRLMDNIFDVKLGGIDQNTGKWQWNTQLFNNIWGS